MAPDPLVHKFGRLITRVLLAANMRKIPGVQWLYTQLYLMGKHLSERKEKRFFRHQLSRGMIIVDIGGNVGFYTKIFAKLVGPEGRVISFEPDPLSFDILKKRMKSFPNVTTVQTALGKEEGHITLHINKTNRADNRIHAPSHSDTEMVDVSLMTLDRYCKEHHVTVIDAIKMDIQGAEVECLEGMKNLMETMPPKWMFIEFSPDDLRSSGSSAEEFWKILSKYEYESYELTDSLDTQRIDHKEEFTARIGDGYTNIWAWRGN